MYRNLNINNELKLEDNRQQDASVVQYSSEIQLLIEYLVNDKGRVWTGVLLAAWSFGMDGCWSSPVWINRGYISLRYPKLVSGTCSPAAESRSMLAINHSEHWK